MSQKEKYLITSALPYANGPLHLGHVAGAYLPADIFVRFKRVNGADIIYICGTDEHGVPITLRAGKEKRTPREVVDEFHENIKSSFEKLNIVFDNFSGTARAEEHIRLSQQFFKDLSENGYILTKEEEQFYCPADDHFLPDRYVEGTCPHCGYEKARGDQCDQCGKLLNATDLINPKCSICGAEPVLKKTSHWYLKLQDFEEKLKTWIQSKKNWKDNVKNFILGWIENEGLRERAITRDLKWGVPVPVEGVEDKVLYVWFDAPIGYISSTMEWAKRIGEPDRWKDYWLSPDTKMIHYIGKDNIPFHAIIWPSMLMGQNEDYCLPYDIPANEYLNLEGRKLSTSLNWAVWVDEYLSVFPADPLRYFLAANAPETKDSDFSWKAFQSRNNEELANILGNFANRTLTFVKNSCGGTVHRPETEDKDVFDKLKNKIIEIEKALNTYHVREACKLIMDVSRIGNRYFDEHKPWVLKKENPEELCKVIYMCMNILRVQAVVMYPVMPESAEKLWDMIGEQTPITSEKWEDLAQKRISGGQKIRELSILFTKYDDKIIQQQIDYLHQKSKINQTENNQKENKNMESEKITIDDFKKIDLRVAEIISAEIQPKSKKLLKLKVKVGEEERQIMAGIKPYYDPETLIGKKIVIVYNLEPAKLMGELSEGMLLAASTEDRESLALLTPMQDIPSGNRIS